uniref:Uncharacterized protein n=1 Tax=Oryza meridionalis TaxID=40149 RepID=A0A0E0D4I5_9ORYZ
MDPITLSRNRSELSNSPSPCANPGHYIALVTLRVAEEMRQPPPPPPARAEQHGTGTVRVTRVKLLKPRDTLLVGQAYRLITVDEVTRALHAKEKSRRAAAQHHLESKPAGAAGMQLVVRQVLEICQVRCQHLNSSSPAMNKISVGRMPECERKSPKFHGREPHKSTHVHHGGVVLLLELGDDEHVQVAHAARRW